MATDRQVLQKGNLVRLFYADEYFGPPFLLGEEQEEAIADLISEISGIRCYFDFGIVKKIDSNLYFIDDIDDEDEGVIWAVFPFGARGIVIDFWLGKDKNWAKILFDKKIAWIGVDFLVPICPG